MNGRDHFACGTRPRTPKPKRKTEPRWELRHSFDRRGRRPPFCRKHLTQLTFQPIRPTATDLLVGIRDTSILRNDVGAPTFGRGQVGKQASEWPA